LVTVSLYDVLPVQEYSLYEVILDKSFQFKEAKTPVRK